MNKKNMTALISALSVFTMLAWGTLAHSYEYAWLAVPAGGIMIAIISIIFDEDREENADGRSDEEM